MDKRTPSTQLRQRILKNRGVAAVEKKTKRMVTHDEVATLYDKTPLMRLLELKHSASIEDLISSDTIYEVAAKLDVDPTTISKWRKLIREANEYERENRIIEYSERQSRRE